MRRRSVLRFPSYRNLTIYHQLAYERRTQTEVAAQLGLSQRRVSQIAQQVQVWVDSVVRPRQYVGRPGMRFHLAVALERIRLQQAHGPLVELFTGADDAPRTLRRYVTVVDGEAKSTIEISDQPDVRLMGQALRVQVRLAELEAIAKLGPLFDLPHQVHQTVVHSSQHSASIGANSPIPLPNPFSTSSKTHSNPSPNQGRGVLPTGSPAA